MRSLLCVAILAADVSAQTYGSASPGANCAPGERCAISASTGCYDGSIPGLTPIVQSQLNATLQQALVLLSQLDGQNATEVTAQLQQQLVEAGAALDGANATELNETLQDALAQPLDALLGPDGVENAAFFGINTSTPLTLLLSQLLGLASLLPANATAELAVAAGVGAADADAAAAFDANLTAAVANASDAAAAAAIAADALPQTAEAAALAAGAANLSDGLAQLVAATPELAGAASVATVIAAQEAGECRRVGWWAALQGVNAAEYAARRGSNAGDARAPLTTPPRRATPPHLLPRSHPVSRRPCRYCALPISEHAARWGLPDGSWTPALDGSEPLAALCPASCGALGVGTCAAPCADQTDLANVGLFTLSLALGLNAPITTAALALLPKELRTGCALMPPLIALGYNLFGSELTGSLAAATGGVDVNADNPAGLGVLDALTPVLASISGDEPSLDLATLTELGVAMESLGETLTTLECGAACEATMELLCGGMTLADLELGGQSLVDLVGGEAAFTLDVYGDINDGAAALQPNTLIAAACGGTCAAHGGRKCGAEVGQLVGMGFPRAAAEEAVQKAFRDLAPSSWHATTADGGTHCAANTALCNPTRLDDVVLGLLQAEYQPPPPPPPPPASPPPPLPAPPSAAAAAVIGGAVGGAVGGRVLLGGVGAGFLIKWRT